VQDSLGFKPGVSKIGYLQKKIPKEGDQEKGVLTCSVAT